MDFVQLVLELEPALEEIVPMQPTSKSIDSDGVDTWGH